MELPDNLEWLLTPNPIVPAVIGSVIAGFGLAALWRKRRAFLNWIRHRGDGEMSREARREQLAYDRDQFCDAVTEGIEKRVNAGFLSREKADAFYKKLKKFPDLREVGPEPTFGKPWYEGPEKTPQPEKVKGRIKTSLKKMKEGLTKVTIRRKVTAHVN